ncbi:unnamed protein product [Prorocentrum cordatum]|uniref:Uncharacterized protein n=1 Tax=Prorocentrum cordatum TaxID=2364126 RepID=A0ABN9P603_9DINO|nr:unnamed protein product [Polarella glacialis]
MFRLGAGRRWRLVATEPVGRLFEGDELRFLIGREVGRVALHHSAPLLSWPLARFASDVFALPRFVLGGAARRGGPSAGTQRRSRAPDPAREMRRALGRAADQLVEVCQLYQGLRFGCWPGLVDLALDLDLLLAGQRAEPVAARELRALDLAAAACAKLRAPGGASALCVATAGVAAPRVAGAALGLSRQEERRLGHALRLASWALRAWSGKLRAEVISADRLGAVAAGGDVDAALRAMVRFAQEGDSAAMVALLGVDQIVEQADVLDRALPPKQFATEPSLPTRVADLAAWSDSLQGQMLLRYGE